MAIQSREFGAMRLAAPPRRSATLLRGCANALARVVTAPLAALLFLMLASWLVVGTGLGVAAYLGRRGLGLAGIR